MQADKSIDFSKINVQLLSKQGSLKYETDCAPNNGYYFIPVYEKGEYILKVPRLSLCLLGIFKYSETHRAYYIDYIPIKHFYL